MSNAEEAHSDPERLTMVNLATDEERSAQYNPTELEESVSVTWKKHQVPGLSYEPLHYQGTGNHTLTLELYYSADTVDEQDALDEDRKFLLSLGYPSRAAVDVLGGAPPRVLFVWPNLMTLTAVVDGEVKIRHQRFTQTGRTTRFTATLTLQEIRDVRLSSEEVRRQGTMRAAR